MLRLVVVAPTTARLAGDLLGACFRKVQAGGRVHVCVRVPACVCVCVCLCACVCVCLCAYVCACVHMCVHVCVCVVVCVWLSVCGCLSVSVCWTRQPQIVTQQWQTSETHRSTMPAPSEFNTKQCRCDHRAKTGPVGKQTVKLGRIMTSSQFLGASNAPAADQAILGGITVADQNSHNSSHDSPTVHAAGGVYEGMDGWMERRAKPARKTGNKMRQSVFLDWSFAFCCCLCFATFGATW